MNIRKSTKYSLLTIGILTTFQLGQVHVKADTTDFSNNTVVQNQDEKATSLNKITNQKSEATANDKKGPVADEGKSASLTPADSTSTTEVAEKEADKSPAEKEVAEEKSVAEQPKAEQPVQEQPTTEQPTTEQPTTEQPKVEQPAAETTPEEELKKLSETPQEGVTTPKDESAAPRARRRRAVASNIKVYEDATYGKYVKATDFGLDTTGKVEASDALQKALKAANEVEGGAAVMVSGNVLLKKTLVIDENYSNVKGLIGSGPSRNNTKILFDKNKMVNMIRKQI